ncbi:MAG: phosphatase PAP2 family protein [Candidatus Aenigmatarchaeota archaeon]
MIQLSFWEIVSFFGTIYFWSGVSMLCALLFFLFPKQRKHLVWFIFLVLPSILIANSITYAIKYTLKVPRPCVGLPNCPEGYSMPSGHATVVFAALSSLVFHYKKREYFLISFIFAEFVALSRVVLGYHRIPEVLVGSFIGIFVGFIVQKVYWLYHKDIEKIIK